MERECKNLDKNLEVYLDGKRVVLPSIESIVILNIPSWAAGVDLWNIGLEGYSYLMLFFILYNIFFII